MRDRFDYETYWEILEHLTKDRPVLRFADFVGTEPAEPFVILRHDVDYSAAAALRLAESEASRSVRATYFLLTGTRYYNLMAPEHSHVARRLVELGHEVGLHYDVNMFRPFPRNEWERVLRAQAVLLGELSGQKVVSIAMHQPGLNGEDPFHEQALGYVNAYDDRFVRGMTYVSDSGRAWRDDFWSMVERREFPSRLQLALHPINWAESDRDRTTIFNTIHQELIDDIRQAGGDLLSRLSVHSGVVQHEARLAKGNS